jgi:hypothetical protein
MMLAIRVHEGMGFTMATPEKVFPLTMRPPLGAQHPEGFLPFSLAKKSTPNLTRAEIAPPFGSPRTRDVSTLATAFPRGELSPPPHSWRHRPVFPLLLTSRRRSTTTPPPSAPPHRRHRSAPPLVALRVCPADPVLGAVVAAPRPRCRRALRRGALGRGGALPTPVRGVRCRAV